VDVFAFLGDGFGVLGLGFAVDPLLDFDEAGAVVNFVCVVGGLLGDGVYLANERELWFG
jgi:hypothetical protein